MHTFGDFIEKSADALCQCASIENIQEAGREIGQEDVAHEENNMKEKINKQIK
jgi:hypothetical protein